MDFGSVLLVANGVHSLSIVTESVKQKFKVVCTNREVQSLPNETHTTATATFKTSILQC